MTAAMRPPGRNEQGSIERMQRKRVVKRSKRTVIATSIAISAVVVGGTASLAAGFFSHSVRDGDTLSGLALEYGTTVDALAELNGISNPDLIVVDDELLIRPVEDGETVESFTGVSIEETRTVLEGDTLTGIAESLGVSVDELAAANGMVNPDLIVTGDILVVPTERDAPEAVAEEDVAEDADPQTDVDDDTTTASNGDDDVATSPVLVTNEVQPPTPADAVQAGSATLHLVLPGETVESIAEMYGVTASQLLAANGQARDGISSGMILKVPPADTGSVQLVGMPTSTEVSPVASEVTAVSVATAYWGASISEQTIIDSLELSDNPHIGFRGDINGEYGGTDDYGVYAGPLSDVVAQHGFVGEAFYAEGAASELTDRIDLGLPVVVWITYQTAVAEPERVEDDTRPFTLVPGKQAVVVYGYDDEGVLVVDVAQGSYSHINWTDFMRSWGYFDGMGLAISPI